MTRKSSTGKLPTAQWCSTTTAAPLDGIGSSFPSFCHSLISTPSHCTFPSVQGSESCRFFLVRADWRAASPSQEGRGLPSQAGPDASGSNPSSRARSDSAQPSLQLSRGTFRASKNHFHLSKRKSIFKNPLSPRRARLTSVFWGKQQRSLCRVTCGEELEGDV